MELVFGVDGGQTSLKGAIASRDGRILGEGRGGGILHLAAADGPARLEQSLRDCLEQCWAAAGLEPRPLRAVVLGLSGVEAGTPEAQRAEAIAGRVLHSPVVHACGDDEIALAGAHGGEPGILAIAGTGSVVLGRNATGLRVQVGGWGWLLGDEGSGAWIGREALRRLLQQADAGVAGALAAQVRQQWQLSDWREIKRVCYAPGFGARELAALVPWVAEAAEAGDRLAQELLAEAGMALAQQVGVAAERLGGLPVAGFGSLFEHLSRFRAGFDHELAQRGLIRISPRCSPLEGALLLARQRAWA
jgi:glucosamine kinase